MMSVSSCFLRIVLAGACAWVLLASGPARAAAPERAAPDVDELRLRMECVAWRRAVLEETFARENRRTAEWTHLKETIWLHLEALSAWERAMLRPWASRDAQDLYIAAAWPQGVLGTQASHDARAGQPAPASRCENYKNLVWLRQQAAN